jgi:hypothetical protein
MVCLDDPCVVWESGMILKSGRAEEEKNFGTATWN